MTNNDISKVYMGVSEVDKIYLGDALIYPTTPPPPEPVYSAMPLTIEVLSGGSINWKSVKANGSKTIEYSKNGGEWSSITSNHTSGVTIDVDAGDILRFRGDNATYAGGTSNYNTFVASGGSMYKVYGNIMSLLDSTGFTNLTTLENASANTFTRLFGTSGLTDASNLILPATTLIDGCYYGLFQNAVDLVSAPELPATTLTNACYRNMFYGCTSLTEAPELPATTLDQYCYAAMFQGSSNLNYIKCLATDISASYCTYNWVSNVASAGTFVKDANMNDWTIGTSGIPTDWVIQNEGEPVYSAMPLTFEIISGGTITWKKSNSNMADRVINYSTDDGNTWNTITSTTAGTEINVNAGDKIEFKSDFPAYGTSSYYTHFGGTAIFKAYGNIMSLVDNVGYETATTLVSGYAFTYLFQGCSGLTDASNLILPATALNVGVYYGMFSSCGNLVNGPELLPATTVNQYDYYMMFYNCTSLISAPEIAATTLQNNCFEQMFAGCSALTAAPVLLAQTLREQSYYRMFYGCTNLNYVKCLATNISAPNCTSNWLSRVSATGTFVKDASMTAWTIDTSGIPNGWTVVDAS